MAKLYLKEWRQYRGFTQQQLADSCNLSIVSVARIESGTNVIDLNQLDAMATALKIDDPRKLLYPPD